MPFENPEARDEVAFLLMCTITNVIVGHKIIGYYIKIQF